MKRFIVLLAIMCVLLTGCQSLVCKKVEVSATVTEMQYKAAYTTLMPRYDPSTKTTTLMPITHHSQYLVTVTYESVSKTFDNQTLYESVKKEDTIQMLLCKYFDKKGNLINQTLKLPK